jgi:hypothetical protein
VQILGLDICADTTVGDEMLRGISGGQRKRVTTGTLEYYFFIILQQAACIEGMLKDFQIN